MVYSAELLVVMTDRLKIVSVRARNVPRVHGHKRLDDVAFLAFLSLAPGKRRRRVLIYRGAILLKHKTRGQSNLTKSASRGAHSRISLSRSRKATASCVDIPRCRPVET